MNMLNNLHIDMAYTDIENITKYMYHVIWHTMMCRKPDEELRAL